MSEQDDLSASIAAIIAKASQRSRDERGIDVRPAHIVAGPDETSAAFGESLSSELASIVERATRASRGGNTADERPLVAAPTTAAVESDLAVPDVAPPAAKASPQPPTGVVPETPSGVVPPTPTEVMPPIPTSVVLQAPTGATPTASTFERLGRPVLQTLRRGFSAFVESVASVSVPRTYVASAASVSALLLVVLFFRSVPDAADGRPPRVLAIHGAVTPLPMHSPVAALPVPAPVVAATKVTAPISMQTEAVSNATSAPRLAGSPPSDRPTVGLIMEANERGNAALADVVIDRDHGQPNVAVLDVATSGWAASLQALSAQPRVAVMRYDALQAARRPGSPHVPALQVVAPVSAERVYFVTRADSPLRHVHDLKGKAVNVGASAGSRALTADSLFRSMFGGPVAPSPGRDMNDVEALEKLRSGSGLDAVMLIGLPAERWLRGLPPAMSSQFKLLSLDRNNPASRAAMTMFLPVSVSGPALGRPVGADLDVPSSMSFLVTADPGKRNESEARAHERAIAALASRMCSVLQTQGIFGTGAPNLAPDLQLDVGWPYSATASAVLSRCSDAAGKQKSAATQSPASPSPSPT